MDRRSPLIPRSSPSHSSTIPGPHCHGNASACAANARTIACRRPIVVNARFRASCCARHPSSIAANTCSSGCSSGTPAARCSPADPGVPSRPIPIPATLRHLHQMKESFTRCKRCATWQAAARRNAGRLSAAICKMRRTEQHPASFSAPQPHYP